MTAKKPCKRCAKLIYAGIAHTCTDANCYYHVPVARPMTAPDVNADVRARFEAWHKETFGHLCRSFQLLEARWEGYRAAHADMAGEVRELVEADREYDEAVEAVFTHQIEDLEAVQERMAVASERRAAALAKFHPTHQEKEHGS